MIFLTVVLTLRAPNSGAFCTLAHSFTSALKESPSVCSGPSGAERGRKERGLSEYKDTIDLPISRAVRGISNRCENNDLDENQPFPQYCRKIFPRLSKCIKFREIYMLVYYIVYSNFILAFVRIEK